MTNAAGRRATIERQTAETTIHVELDVDGTGRADVTTGIGFYDHMLTAFAKHGRFDLTLRCTGDLEVDAHHTMEDCGIALGAAFDRALGDRAGLVRMGASDATTVREALRRRGVFVRTFDHPRLRQHLRISAGTPQDTDRVIAALAEVGRELGVQQ